MCVDSTLGGEDMEEMGVDLETDFEWEPQEVCVGLGVHALGQGCWSIKPRLCVQINALK